VRWNEKWCEVEKESEVMKERERREGKRRRRVLYDDE